MRPAAAGGGEHQPRLRAVVERRRLPAVDDPHRRVEVVGQQVAVDVGAADPELPGRAQQVGERLRRADREDRAVAVGGRDAAAVPELDRERPLGKGALDLAAQGLGAGEGHPH